MKHLSFVSILFLLFFCPSAISAQQKLVDLVNLYMGVQGNSNCVIGPQMPHGSVNPGPQTVNGGQGGYKQNQPVRGFAQLHVSGSGWTRYGQIFLSPQMGFNALEDGHDSMISEEIARPYYYKAKLDRYNILAELSPSFHSIIYRFTYLSNGEKTLLLDMKHNIAQHIATEVRGTFSGGEIKQIAPGVLVGWGEYAGGFGSKAPYKVYFVLQLDNECEEIAVVDKGVEALYAKVLFKNETRQTLVRVGISMKSVENALNYLEKEVGNKSLEQVCATCEDTWNDMLQRIRIKGGTEEAQQLFYTTFYHSLVMPHDRTGDNPRWESDMPHIDDHYCVWDTWRTTYPLLNLINQSFVVKTINSFIDRYEHDGMCTATFTSSMEWPENQGGDDVDNIIADAFMCDVQGFDRQRAYNLVLNNALNMRDKQYQKKGWISGAHEMMSCSYTLEYAYNDYCVAEIAKMMGDESNHKYLSERSLGWKNLFNPNLESHGFKGFIGPKDNDGNWISIDPAHRYGSWVEYFYEDNSWAYTLFTPGHVDELIKLCGGKEAMTNRLQYGFENKLLGLNNEPEFLAPYLFVHCGHPEMAANYVSRLRDSLYSLKDGYPDNEDSGAMGAWYVFSSIGLFPHAGQGFYYLIPPKFDDISLSMENGKALRIVTVKSDEGAKLIDHVTLNGVRLDSYTVSYKDIKNGAELIFYLK